MTVVDGGVTVTEMGLDGKVTVTDAEPRAVGTAVETAVTITPAGVGTKRGAVY